MPPPGEPRPETQRIDQFVAFMEASIDRAAAGQLTPGYVPLHRLNRKEYANAVRDLLALEIDAATLLPQDDKTAGFDNIAGALQVSPSFIEQYVTAARTIADRAIGDAAAAPESQTYKNPIPGVGFGSTTGGGRPQHIEGLPLGTRGGFAVDHFFPADGEYELNINDMAARCGSKTWSSRTRWSRCRWREDLRACSAETRIRRRSTRRRIPAVDAINAPQEHPLPGQGRAASSVVVSSGAARWRNPTRGWHPSAGRRGWKSG